MKMMEWRSSAALSSRLQGIQYELINYTNTSTLAADGFNISSTCKSVMGCIYSRAGERETLTDGLSEQHDEAHVGFRRPYWSCSNGCHSPELGPFNNVTASATASHEYGGTWVVATSHPVLCAVSKHSAQNQTPFQWVLASAWGFHVTDSAGSNQLLLNECGTEARRPQVTDIAVQCGTSSIGLAIEICPVIYTGYNETLLFLNHMVDPVCRATIDESVSPPVARFNFPLNTTHACGSIFRTTSAAGTGVFSDFSNIQTVNISGVVRSVDPTPGTVTYNAELKYYYSCAYPLEYLINNTQVDVSASSIAIKDNNGSFISTLSMELFSDANFTRPMFIPQLGIELRTTMYVEVKATNLTGQYHVLLDRCYASISPLPNNSSFFNLFVPCSQDRFTTVVENGVSQSSRFHFPAFRFIEQQNETVSTYYLHCITRLCEKSTCSAFKQCNKRRKRNTVGQSSLDLSDTYTISSSEIVTKANTLESKEEPLVARDDGGSDVGLGVAVGILGFVCLVALCVAAVFYKKLRN
ncbi:zona pellucida-like domain-containing protein 1 [Anoplopoma fimbria]|uniref:zona pellucida-like domain-containing protein 1 n=1 Tax=Anoplopoma fimbria TaxID=229290 RepID=UPI0023EA992A|nr:zona pellucida-like domain-containing protein 1 [Anoplopoma fimbria]